MTNTVRGVDLEITARDPEIQREIIELARFHASIGDPKLAAEQHHTGMHGGPGDIGYCPIIHNATTVSFTKLANGAVIHVSALPGNVTRLQATVAERIGRLAAH